LRVRDSPAEIAATGFAGRLGTFEVVTEAVSTFFGREVGVDEEVDVLGGGGRAELEFEVVPAKFAASSAFFFFHASSFSRFKRFFSSSAAVAADVVLAEVEEEEGRGEAEPDTAFGGGRGDT